MDSPNLGRPPRAGAQPNNEAGRHRASKGTKQLRGRLAIAGVVGVLLATAAGATAWALNGTGKAATAATPGVNALDRNSSTAAATVDGEEISELELMALMNTGLDRANALDRQVDKAVLANLALKRYSGDAQAAVRGAEREVLSQLYVSKRGADLRSAVTDAEIKAFYEQEIPAANFTGYRVSFLLSQDPKEVEAVVQAVAGGQAAAVSDKFKPVKDKGDPFAGAAELPYGLGNVVSRLKVGEYSVPMQVRNGLLIVRLDETKANPKPGIDTLKAQILDVIVARRFAAEVADARRAAQVVLK